MGWTVIKEDFEGNVIDQLAEEFHFNDIDILYNSNYKVIKYLNLYDDTTFNSLMFDDLINDLNELKKRINTNTDLIDKIIQLAITSKNDTHTYIKFYGD